MNESMQMDILEIAKNLMALPKDAQQIILNRAYGMCMYALAVGSNKATEGGQDKQSA